MATRLTERVVKALESPFGRPTITWDSELGGFGVRITTKGVKAFILDYRAGGRQRRMTIGRYPEWSVAAARDEARLMRRDVDAGGDPMADRHSRRGAPTVQDLFDRYAAEHLPTKRPRSAADDESMWRLVILPRLGSLRVADLTPTDVDRLHQDVTNSGRPVRANRTIEVLRKALNLAIRWGWIDKNVAVGVRRNAEERRNRYLTNEEITRLCQAIERHPNRQSANAIRFLMLTGARRGEVLSARWDQFDLATGVWVKPSSHTKQRREHRVPLSAPAIQLLADMREGAESDWLFPNPNGGHQVDIKRTWNSLCQDAGLVEVVGHEVDREGNRVPILRNALRIHDLRHTYASLLASGGASLPLIGALLGHTQPATTARYAHLLDDPLRRATERVGTLVDAAANGNTAEVVSMTPE